jgi:hypothetical protein
MTQSGMRPFSLAILLIIASTIGCQSMRGPQSAAMVNGNDAIQTVKSEQPLDDRGAMVRRSRELESSSNEAGSEDPGNSLWSKLRSPTRFLLPRTDADAQSATDLETGPGLDDGF